MTGFLVRSIGSKWSKGSVLAVDAGSHLSAITRLLESNFPRVSGASLNGAIPQLSVPNAHPNGRGSLSGATSEQDYDTSDESRASSLEPSARILDSGPFAGLPFPYESARANALYLVRECVSTYLITHPHLDHLSAFAINTAAFHNTSRPKRLAALPSTVNAIKSHIFNDVIWPNLTDEDGGVGFVTFQRLTDGGNLAVGHGPGKGYMEICDGLCVKGMKVSHGHCTRGANMPTQPRGSEVGLSEVPTFRMSHSASQHGGESISPTKTRRTPSITQLSMPGTPGVAGAQSASTAGAHPLSDHTSREVVVDSTAYFIRDDPSGRELLFFGDVEPDMLSLNPRTAAVWAEAAPKIAAGHLRAVMIECSYDDSQGDSILFGHLAPRHLFKELTSLADIVKRKRQEKMERRHSRKRKRSVNPGSQSVNMLDPSASVSMRPIKDVSMGPSDDEPDGSSKRGRVSGRLSRLATTPTPTRHDRAVSPLARYELNASAENEHPWVHVAEEDSTPPLADLTVVVIHVKDTLRDGPLVGDTILQQLRDHEATLKESDGIGLGCNFVISKVGESYMF